MGKAPKQGTSVKRRRSREGSSPGRAGTGRLRVRWWWFVVALVLVFLVWRVVVLWGGDPESEDPVLSEAPVSQELLAVGEELYQTTCATCHGSQGGGFAAPRVPAPPLDGSAHSWHHPDAQIMSWIREGGVQMPAVGAAWSDDEVRAVMAYFKQWWEPWQQEAQTGGVGESIQGEP